MDIPTKEQVLAAAETCVQARAALEKLFPQYFDKPKSFDDLVIVKDGALLVHRDLRNAPACREMTICGEEMRLYWGVANPIVWKEKGHRMPVGFLGRTYDTSSDLLVALRLLDNAYRSMT